MSDPLYSEIAKDKETFQKNVKRYMNGQDVDGRTFASDFLKDLEAKNIKEENMKIVEKSDSNEGIAVNLPSDNKGMEKLLDKIKQLGVRDKKETVNDNIEATCGKTYKDHRVQRAAARYCLNDYNFTSSVTEMLKVLNWQTLENRRIQNLLILLYKIKHNLVAVDHHHLTETKNLNFFVPYSRTLYHMNSFFPEQSDTGTVSYTV